MKYDCEFTSPIERTVKLLCYGGLCWLELNIFLPKYIDSIISNVPVQIINTNSITHYRNYKTPLEISLISTTSSYSQDRCARKHTEIIIHISRKFSYTLIHNNKKKIIISMEMTNNSAPFSMTIKIRMPYYTFTNCDNWIINHVEHSKNSFKYLWHVL